MRRRDTNINTKTRIENETKRNIETKTKTGRKRN